MIAPRLRSASIRRLAGAALACALLQGPGAQAAEVDQRGPVVAAEGRAFFAPPREVLQAAGPSGSLVSQPEITWTSDGGGVSFAFEPFARMDTHDPARTHADLRQAALTVSPGRLEAGLGVGQHRWGVLQLGGLVDIINQRDIVEDIDGQERLGQPYALIGWGGNNLEMSALYLPVQRARTFPGLSGRLRPALGVDASDPQYESAWGPLHPGYAARATAFLGPAELSASGYSGLSRDPRYVAQFTDSRVATAYDQLQQVSGDGALVAGSFVFVAEGAWHRWGEERIPSPAAGGGARFTRPGIFGSRMDLTLLLEHTWDPRPVGTPVTVYDNDTSAGLHLRFNDAHGTSLSGAVVRDWDTGFLFARGAVERRLDEHWKAHLEGTLFAGDGRATEWWLVGEDYLMARIAYYL